METPHIEKQIRELQSQVAPYSKNKAITLFSLPSFQEIISSKKIYIGIPIVVLLLLLVSRPRFIYYEKSNKEKSISIKKTLLMWLIFSSVLVIGLFGYNYTKNN